MKSTRYVIISPVRNEAEHLPETIRSVSEQSSQPQQWIIVNDGSTDRSPEVIDEAAKQFPWITAVHRADRGFRKSGTGVMEAFYDGYDRIADPSWDFLVKLDGDLSFDQTYFEKCFRKFSEDTRLGVGGGTICRDTQGEWIPEAPEDPLFHVRGATKIYRRTCWDAIGGLIRTTGWDTFDEVKANMLGWQTCTFPELKLLHHRPAGKADGSWKNWFKNGRANYIVGYHPLFMFLKCARRMLAKPYVVCGSALWAGYMTGYLKRCPRVNDEDVIRYFRRQQINRLLLRKNLWS